MTLLDKINKSKAKAVEFLTNIADARQKTFGIKKCSSFHNIEKYPDMLLPATYNATNALILMNAYSDTEESKKKEIADFINRFQIENGTYRFKNMKDEEIWKGRSVEYSWEYINNHITNYSMGTLKNLGYKTKYPLTFMHKYFDEHELLSWLNERDMTNPWLEDNNIVNMTSFLIYELEGKDDSKLKKLIDLILDWHDETQDPNTGYWGTNHPIKPADSLNGMAGAAHNYHIFFYFNRKINYYDKIIDHCIEFINNGGVKSACLDVDVVDILVNMLPYNYRKSNILKALEEFAHKLIDFQNEDGGFADEKNGIVRRMDGWVGGYFEPQGLSNCFATWFRTITLGMIACALYPEQADQWTFKNTIGIGYFNKKSLDF